MTVICILAILENFNLNCFALDSKILYLRTNLWSEWFLLKLYQITVIVIFKLDDNAVSYDIQIPNITCYDFQYDLNCYSRDSEKTFSINSHGNRLCLKKVFYYNVSSLF